MVLPCSRTGLNVLPEGDHMNAIFAPKGSGALGDRLAAAGALGITASAPKGSEVWEDGSSTFRALAAMGRGEGRRASTEVRVRAV